jgi:hypothetical protein
MELLIDKPRPRRRLERCGEVADPREWSRLAHQAARQAGLCSFDHGCFGL